MQYLVQPVLKNNLNYPGKIPAKRYSIASSNSGLCLGVRSSDGFIIQTAWKDTADQHWIFEKLGDNLFKIVHAATGKVATRVPELADKSGGLTTPAVLVRSWTGSDDQKWYFDHLSGSNFRIRVKSTGWCFNINYNSTQDGVGLYLRSYDGNAKMQFRIAEVIANRLEGTFESMVTIYDEGGFGGSSRQLGPGSYPATQLRADAGTLNRPIDTDAEYEIVTLAGLALTVNQIEGGVCQEECWRTVMLRAPGKGEAPVEVSEEQRWGSKRQRWRFELQDDGYYKIASVDEGLVFDVPGASADDGEKLGLWDWNGGDNQRWQVEEQSDGKFILIAKHSGKVMEVREGSKSPGAVIQQCSRNGSDAQVFQLVPVKRPGFRVGSLRVPSGLRVILHQHETFDGVKVAIPCDVEEINCDVGAVVVEPMAILYSLPNFEGDSQSVAMGAYDALYYEGNDVSSCAGYSADLDIYHASKLELGEDRIASVRVPAGMQVELYSDPGFKGEAIILTTDAPDLGEYISKASSVIVKMIGVAAPDHPLKFGDTVALRSEGKRVLRLLSDEQIATDPGDAGDDAHFTIVRAGATMNRTYVAFGDVVALRAPNGKYLSQTGPTRANSSTLGDAQKWVIYRAGPSESRVLASRRDTVAFRRAVGNSYLADGGTSGYSWNDWPRIDQGTKFKLAVRGDLHSAVAPLCGGQAILIAECGGDVCGAAMCGAQAAVVNACGVAAVGVMLCGVDVAGVIACGTQIKGITACGGNFCGAAACAVAACGADGCGGAACGAAVCGAAACLGNGCGGNACGVDACPANLCAGNACGGNACGVALGLISPLQLCGANVCGIDLCPMDACAVDACGIDLIPVIPGI